MPALKESQPPPKFDWNAALDLHEGNVQVQKNIVFVGPKEAQENHKSISNFLQAPAPNSVKVNEARAASIQNEVSSYFTGFVDESVMVVYRGNPPFITCIEQATSDFSFGIHFHNSNHIILSPRQASENQDEAVRHTLVHENIHYLANIGRMQMGTAAGSGVTLSDTFYATTPDGKDIRYPFATETRSLKWLDEGITEMFALRLLQENGAPIGECTHPSGKTGPAIAYMNEVKVALILEQIAGKDVLAQAYMSGDFTEVRNKVDAALGEGAFDALMTKPNGAEALLFLVDQNEKAKSDGRPGFDLQAVVKTWDSWAQGIFPFYLESGQTAGEPSITTKDSG